MSGARPARMVRVMTGRMRLVVVFAVSIALVAACSSPAAPVGSGGGPAASTGAAAATAAGSTAPSGDPNFVHLVDVASGIGSVEDVAAAENRIIDAFAQSSGLITGLGADTWAYTNQLAHEALAEGGESIALTGEASLMAALNGGPPRVAVAGAAGVGLAFATAMIGTGFAGSAGINTPLNSTQTKTANGETTTGTMTGHINYSTSGSQVTADVEIGVAINVVDANTGAAIRSGSFRSQGKITLDFCPDVNGKVKGHVSVSIDGSTSGAGSASIRIEADVEGSVDDSATLIEIGVDANSTQTTTPPGGSARTLTTSANYRAPVGARGNVLNINASQATGQSLTQGPGDLTQAEASAAAEQIGSAAGSTVYLIGEFAQKKWRGGECVEIRATEQSRDVAKNELIQFESKVWHKIENVELHKNIVNEFTGKSSVDPVDIPVPAPVTNSFKAGPMTNDTGTITMTTTSNRGIGVLSLTFRVKGGWLIDTPNRGGRLSGLKCGDPTGEWVVKGTYSALGMTGKQDWTITINADEATGKFVYYTDQQGNPGGAPVTVYVSGFARGNVTLSIDPVTSLAHMHLTETFHTYNATTELGGEGSDQDAPLESYDLDWPAGGNC